MPFFGNEPYTLDERGRVAIPARFRDEFGTKAMLTMGMEGCVAVHTLKGYDIMSDKYASLPATTPEGRQARRKFDAQAFPVDLDRQGRILIPQQFRDQAGLGGPVVIAGAREYLEVWNPERWRRQLQAEPAASSAEQASAG